MVCNKQKNNNLFLSHTVEHWTRCVSDGILIKVPNGSIPFTFRPWINMPLNGCFDSILTEKFRNIFYLKDKSFLPDIVSPSGFHVVLNFVIGLVDGGCGV